MFYIKNSRDFYEKLLQEFDDFQQDQLSARYAINCAITAYHMHEWVWGDWLKTDYAVWKKLGIRDKESFVAWLEGACPGFNTAQDIANGSKHFDRTAMQKTGAWARLTPRPSTTTLLIRFALRSRWMTVAEDQRIFSLKCCSTA